MKTNLHQQWLIEAIAVRQRLRSDSTPYGKAELERLQLELSQYEKENQESHQVG